MTTKTLEYDPSWKWAKLVSVDLEDSWAQHSKHMRDIFKCLLDDDVKDARRSTATPSDQALVLVMNHAGSLW